MNNITLYNGFFLVHLGNKMAYWKKYLPLGEKNYIYAVQVHYIIISSNIAIAAMKYASDVR